MDDLQFSYTQQARLDWFAANAPEEPPEWFVGPVEPLPPPAERDPEAQPPYPENEEAAATVRQWLADVRVYRPYIEDLYRKTETPEAQEQVRQWANDLLERIEDRNAERERLEQRNRIARYFAWRRYYAENVKAALDEEAAENLSAADFPVGGDADEPRPRAQQG